MRYGLISPLRELSEQILVNFEEQGFHLGKEEMRVVATGAEAEGELGRNDQADEKEYYFHDLSQSSSLSNCMAKQITLACTKLVYQRSVFLYMEDLDSTCYNERVE